MKKYFEFNKQEYYAIVTVEADQDSDYIYDATEVYDVELVSGDGDNVEEILKAGKPTEVTKEYAFWMLANCSDTGNYLVEDLLRDFNEKENTVIVIDGDLT